MNIFKHCVFMQACMIIHVLIIFYISYSHIFISHISSLILYLMYVQKRKNKLKKNKEGIVKPIHSPDRKKHTRNLTRNFSNE